MKTTPHQRRWKTWVVGAALTVVAGASGYILFSGSSGEAVGSKMPAGLAAEKQAQNQVSVVDSVRRAISEIFGAVKSFGGFGSQDRAAFVVLPRKGPVQGSPLVAAGMNPQNDKGRIVKLDRSALKGWAHLKEGEQVSLPSLDGEPVVGEIQLRMEDNGWVRFGGTLPGNSGTFSLNTNFDQVAGSMLFPDTERAFEIRSDASGEVVMVERRLSSLVCWPYSVPEVVSMANVASAATDSSTLSISQGGQVPEINTRPGAKGVIYIDFDGEVVRDPSWNGGRDIVALPSRLTPSQIREVVERVAEDYAPFDITITTSRSVYDEKPPGRRMRVIVTPTATAAPGAGGVAMVGSWADSGKGMSSTVPAWVFNSSTKAIAEAVSHEAGHTFGLNHDGTTSTQYYSGHGGGLDVPTSWAPIMGNSYGRSLTQWSKGEYRNANNKEDDLAVISSPINGVGYRTDVLGGRSLTFSGNSFQLNGVLLSSSSSDIYQFQTSGGDVNAIVMPSSKYSNADLKIELRDSLDRTLAVSDPVDALGATLNKTGIAAGTYRLIVRAAGTGPVPVGGYTTGYSEYGSIGGYTLSGSVGNVIAAPYFGSGLSAVGTVGQAFVYQIVASANAVIAAPTGELPPGLSYNTESKAITGTPLVSGSWNLTLSASNDMGSTTQVVNIRIDDPALPLESVLGGVKSLTTSPAQAPWVGTSIIRADGQTGLVAVSGRLADGGTSKMQFSVPGQSVLSFWWRSSSEAGGDGVVCRINGTVARDADSGEMLVLSGESGWVKQRVRLDRAGYFNVEFTYSKDAALSSGLDRAWVYGVEVARPPIFNETAQFPRSQTVNSGDKTFTLKLEAEGATSYQWKKDGVTLIDGANNDHVISGATTSTLTVSGVVGADSGFYTLEAGNASGKVTSRRCEVIVSGPPEIIQQPVAPVGLKMGDSLMLSVKASGPQPIFCLWTKNGTTVQWSPSSVYQVRSVKASNAGTYQVYVVNRYGFVQSADVEVTVGNAAPAPKKTLK